MRVSDVISVLESIAPLRLAAEWDNVGLLIGDVDATVRKMLLCIDLTDDVLAEAKAVNAQMVMAYHPPIFKPISRLTTTAEAAVYHAARRGLAVYSMHTAFDSAVGGTNDVLAGLVGIRSARPLTPASRGGECKVVTFVPPADLANVAEAAFAAGAGRIGNYLDCAFFTHGVGTFMGGDDSHPAIGMPGQHEVTEEVRLEMVCPAGRAGQVATAIRIAHRYEQPVIDVYPLAALPEGCGMGRIGRLAKPTSERALIERIKKALGMARLTLASGHPTGRTMRKVTTVACCGGACGKLFHTAIAEGATFYLTGEMHHHDALAATAAGMTVACAGHSNSERIALTHLAKRVSKALPKLVAAVAKTDKDPFEIV